MSDLLFPRLENFKNNLLVTTHFSNPNEGLRVNPQWCLWDYLLVGTFSVDFTYTYLAIFSAIFRC